MLGFFRRHQKIFFYFVTAIVVVTMTFFGSMWRFRGPTKGEDPVVFQALDGTPVTQHQLAKMVVFLSSDAEDKIQSGGIWGPNFLNDGVVRKDLLETGLGTMLATEYFDHLQADLRVRREREKNHVPYAHAHARFLNATSVWENYAPELLQDYQRLRDPNATLTPEAFDTRVALYLKEQRFPQMALKQVLRHQEEQYSWIPQDPYLFRQDLALFGYHTLEDWFGPRFMTLAAEFVINASILAQQKGYSVSDAEAWAELQRHAQQSFSANRHSPYLDVDQPSAYIDQQLQHMGMDRGAATTCWRQVMLFRRLFDEVGNAALVDRFSFERFSEYADQEAELQVYTLSSDLYLPNYKALQAFECYLDAVADRNSSDPLALPQNFHTVAEIKERAPELVKRRYLLEVAQVHRAAIALRIPIKELWNVQLDVANWEAITEKFPVLASCESKTREDRLSAIDSLDRQSRRHLDTWAQEHRLAAHPEWIQEALDEIQPREVELGLTASGGTLPLAGVKDRDVLRELLDSGEPITGYTEDGNVYSRIRVLERAESEQILTFKEARESNALDTTMQRRLGDPGRARDAAADELYASVLEETYRSALALEPWDTQLPDTATGEYAAKHRFRSHLARIRDDVIKYGKDSSWVCSETDHPLARQWQVIPRHLTVRRQGAQPYGQGKPYEMTVGSWSEITIDEGASPYFYLVADKSVGILKNTNLMDHAQQVLSRDARRCYMQQLLSSLQDQEALSLARVFSNE